MITFLVSTVAETTTGYGNMHYNTVRNHFEVDAISPLEAINETVERYKKAGPIYSERLTEFVDTARYFIEYGYKEPTSVIQSFDEKLVRIEIYVRPI
jgi:hypothetical protein